MSRRSAVQGRRFRACISAFFAAHVFIYVRYSAAISHVALQIIAAIGHRQGNGLPTTGRPPSTSFACDQSSVSTCFSLILIPRTYVLHMLLLPSLFCFLLSFLLPFQFVDWEPYVAVKYGRKMRSTEVKLNRDFRPSHLFTSYLQFICPNHDSYEL